MKYILAVTVVVSFITGCDSVNSAAENAVSRQLIDPDSAQFRDLVKVDDGAYVCGEVNSKNRMGGYTGFTEFMYETEAGKATIDSGANAILIMTVCSGVYSGDEIQERLDMWTQ